MVTPGPVRDAKPLHRACRRSPGSRNVQLEQELALDGAQSTGGWQEETLRPLQQQQQQLPTCAFHQVCCRSTCGHVALAVSAAVVAVAVVGGGAAVAVAVAVAATAQTGAAGADKRRAGWSETAASPLSPNPDPGQQKLSGRRRCPRQLR